MKALTLWQPWASLIAMGQKKVETRCWSTDYRGPIAIHSAKRLPSDWLGASRHSQSFQFELREVFATPSFATPSQTLLQAKVERLPRGCVLCVVNLVGIEQTRLVGDEVNQRERIFGNYEEGRYAWFLEMVGRFETPIPAKGNRMLWEWTR